MSSPRGRKPGSEREPTEAEMRAAYEDQLRRVTTIDAVLQSAVTLINIAGIRLGLGPADEVGGAEDRDLEQARDAIDAVRALLPVLERRIADEVRPLRDALAQIQLAFTREVQLGEDGAGTGATPAQPAAQPPAAGAPGAAPPPPVKPEESAVESGRLWVPGR